MDRCSRSGAGAQHLEDDDVRVPVEVLQNIQWRLPVKAAGRTSVLSKSWLRAWSTIPTLRFHHYHNPSALMMSVMELVDNEHILMKLKEDMDRTLMRYIRDNIPIETFDLCIEIENQDSASLAENWILLLATKTLVKELSLKLNRSCLESEVVSVNLPLEILSSENLTKLKVIADYTWYTPHTARMTSNNHPLIIKCSSLRELHLHGLHVSQNILDAILSSCSSSLHKVHLSQCRSLDTIKVKDLPCLYKLSIDTNDNDLDYSTDFVISHLPNLHIFSLRVRSRLYERPSFNAHLISLAAGSSNLTQLSLDGVIMDTTSLDLIKSGFPFLESLTLDMTSWMLGSIHFTSACITRLSLFDCPSTVVDIQIHAPKLLFFRFHGYELPTTLLFPISTLEQIRLILLEVDMGAVNASFFLKMREALTLSPKCYLHIETYNSNQLPWDIDVNHLRTSLLLPPARNVKELCFETNGDECRWKRSPFFDAFFEICHPEMVFAMADGTYKHSNHFCRLMRKEVLANNYKNKTRTQTVYWPHYLEHVQIKNGLTQDRPQNWEPLTNSWRSLIDGSTPHVYMHFKLKWRYHTIDHLWLNN